MMIISENVSDLCETCYQVTTELIVLETWVLEVCVCVVLFFFIFKVSPLPCHAVGPYSCKRVCGRTLDCQNHICMKECHKVTETEACLGKNKVMYKRLHISEFALKYF